MTLLAVNDITVRYGRLTALRGISLRIDEGEVLFVTGPNGAGKSTLLKVIAGQIEPDSGENPRYIHTVRGVGYALREPSCVR